MSKTNLPPALGLMRKYFIAFFLPIAYILVLNLIGIIPPFYLFVVFLIAIVWRFAASSTRKWLSGFTALLCFIPSLIVVRTFVQEFRYVNGTSMEPSLRDRDRVIVDKLIYRFSEPIKGDIIIFSDKLDDSDRIGRVVTLPDENIDAPIKIPQDSYLVQINSKDASGDTNFRGVKKSEIIGRVKNRFWPINRIGLIHPEKIEALEAFKKFEELKKEEIKKEKLIAEASIVSSGTYKCSTAQSAMELNDDAQRVARDCLEKFLTQKNDSWFTFSLNDSKDNWSLEEWKSKYGIVLESSNLSRVDELNEVQWRGNGRLGIDAIRKKEGQKWSRWNEPSKKDSGMEWLNDSLFFVKNSTPISNGLFLQLQCVKGVWNVELGISGAYKKPDSSIL